MTPEAPIVCPKYGFRLCAGTFSSPARATALDSISSLYAVAVPCIWSTSICSDVTPASSIALRIAKKSPSPVLEGPDMWFASSVIAPPSILTIGRRKGLVFDCTACPVISVRLAVSEYSSNSAHLLSADRHFASSFTCPAVRSIAPQASPRFNPHRDAS